MTKKRGFTLIELLVVIIIIAILASVAIPMMGDMRRRAIVTEMIQGLGTIRTAARLYYVEYQTYGGCTPGGGNNGWFGGGNSIAGIKARPGGAAGTYGTGDLDGAFFSEECYYIAVTVGPPDTFLYIVW